MSHPTPPPHDCHPSCPPDVHERAIGGITFFLNSLTELVRTFIHPRFGSIVIREVVDSRTGATFHAICQDSPTSTPDSAEGALLFLISLDSDAHKHIKPVFNTSTQGFLGHEIPRSILYSTFTKAVRDASS